MYVNGYPCATPPPSSANSPVSRHLDQQRIPQIRDGCGRIPTVHRAAEDRLRRARVLALDSPSSPPVPSGILALPANTTSCQSRVTWVVCPRYIQRTNGTTGTLCTSMMVWHGTYHGTYYVHVCCLVFYADNAHEFPRCTSECVCLYHGSRFRISRHVSELEYDGTRGRTWYVPWYVPRTRMCIAIPMVRISTIG